MDARIITTDDDKALNLYLVLEEDGRTIGDKERQQEIITALELGICYPDDAEPRVSRRIPRQNKYFSTETKIRYSPDTAKNRTLLRLVTMDRPGLLADVGQAFSACRIRLHNAKIATIGAEVEDIFFITNWDDQPVADPEQLECLRSNLLRRLDRLDGSSCCIGPRP
jgi:[protein-PII] uridylyltransferase